MDRRVKAHDLESRDGPQIFARVVHFAWLRRDLGRFSPWAKFVRARSALDEFIYEEIAARRAEGDGARGGDVLSLLLEAEHEDGSRMIEQELRDELVTVVGPGTRRPRPHSPGRSTGTPYAARPGAAARVGRCRGRRLPRSDDQGVASRSPGHRRRGEKAHRAVGRRRLPASGGHVRPAGARRAALPRGPLSEPEEFRPERFLDGKVDHYAWIPFGGGVRRCAAAAFASYEMRIVLWAILGRAEPAAPEPRPERVKLRNITLAPAEGGRVVLKRALAQGQAAVPV